MSGHPDTIPGKACINCQEPIPWRDRADDRERAKYCSETCRRTKFEFIPRKSCVECGGQIPWLDGPKARERAKFCGNPCKFAYQKQHPPRPRKERAIQPCGWCGKPVEFLPSQRTARKLKGLSETVYCNRECKGKAHSRLMTGRRPSNGVYTSPSTFRLMIRREFYNRCAICGWDKLPCDVAHIDSRKNGGADSIVNVTMLCPNHHREYDGGLIPIEEIYATRVNVLRHQPSPPSPPCPLPLLPFAPDRTSSRRSGIHAPT
jgi:hypothetical protein